MFSARTGADDEFRDLYGNLHELENGLGGHVWLLVMGCQRGVHLTGAIKSTEHATLIPH